MPQSSPLSWSRCISASRNNLETSVYLVDNALTNDHPLLQPKPGSIKIMLVDQPTGELRILLKEAKGWNIAINTDTVVSGASEIRYGRAAFGANSVVDIIFGALNERPEYRDGVVIESIATEVCSQCEARWGGNCASEW